MGAFSHRPLNPSVTLGSSHFVSLQGGGIRIDGTATLTDINVYENQADEVLAC